MFFGLIIVLIGVVFLLQNLGIITGNAWNYIWPVIIILIGLSMLFKPLRRKFFCWHGRDWWKSEKDKSETEKEASNHRGH